MLNIFVPGMDYKKFQKEGDEPKEPSTGVYTMPEGTHYPSKAMEDNTATILELSKAGKGPVLIISGLEDGMQCVDIEGIDTILKGVSLNNFDIDLPGFAIDPLQPVVERCPFIEADRLLNAISAKLLIGENLKAVGLSERQLDRLEYVYDRIKISVYDVTTSGFDATRSVAEMDALFAKELGELDATLQSYLTPDLMREAAENVGRTLDMFPVEVRAKLSSQEVDTLLGREMVNLTSEKWHEGAHESVYAGLKYVSNDTITAKEKEQVLVGQLRNAAPEAFNLGKVRNNGKSSAVVATVGDYKVMLCNDPKGELHYQDALIAKGPRFPYGIRFTAAAKDPGKGFCDDVFVKACDKALRRAKVKGMLERFKSALTGKRQDNNPKI